jgi:hypothetical protein
MIDRDYMGAWDLVDPETGQAREYTLKIASVKSELLKSKEVPKGKRKVVIRFAGAQKAFVANSTNCTVISEMYGPDVEGWIGKSVRLHQADVRDPKTGGTVKGIRVRPRKPTGPAEAIASQPVDPEMRAAQSAAFDPPATAPKHDDPENFDR